MEFGIVHQEIVHLHGWQQQCVKRGHILNNKHIVDNNMQVQGSPNSLAKDEEHKCGRAASTYPKSG